MNPFVLDPADEEFQGQMRAFIQRHLPANLARRGRRGFHPTRDDVQRWTRILNEHGLAASSWPAEYGGVAWSAIRRYLFQVELAVAGCPHHDIFGFDLVGPVIYSFGSEAQKARYLPAIRRADEFWCQGFSEPNAGSDLASLKTRADRDGDFYIVNGQKTWTTDAHKADLMLALVRTNVEAKPQAGISALLIEMNLPGVTVRPIYTIDEGHSVNEVFLDNVRVPLANRVGEENKGWSYAKFLLTNERTASAEVPHTRHDLEVLKIIAADETLQGTRPIEDPLFSAKLARFEIDLLALEYAVLRVLQMRKEDPAINSVASVLKIRGAELRQRVAELSVEALGEIGLALYRDIEGQDNMDRTAPVPPAPEIAAGILAKAMFRRATTIYGGANEVQRNIIAKTILDL